MELLAVPGCDATLAVAVGRRHDRVAFAEYFVDWSIAVLATWLGARYRVIWKIRDACAS